MKKGNPSPLSEHERKELETLAALPDDTIDTTDAAAVTDFTGAVRGRFYRPLKQQLTLRLDADVVAWFRQHVAEGEGYQTKINAALREYVRTHSSASKRTPSRAGAQARRRARAPRRP
jgi:uncharacterized protein (DUF4415 family)